MKTHTPGPWVTSRDAVPDGYVQITVYAETTGRRVATAFEDEGNAPLISAAPDLLAALRDLTASCRIWAPAIDRSRAMAAIAKAQP